MTSLNVSAAAFAAALTIFAYQAEQAQARPGGAPKQGNATTQENIQDGRAGRETKQQAEQKGAAAKSGKFHDIVSRYARSYGVPLDLAHAVIRVESNYRPNARGQAGEIGLMQIKPATAKMMGYNGSTEGLFNPDTNIKFGMKYLAKAHELSGGTTCGTILKYNAGHGARRMNRISSAYCQKVKRHLAGA